MATTKRAPAKPAAAAVAPAPLANAALLGAALASALWLLVSRGRLSWPPTELLDGALTLTGCLGLVGPIVLARRQGGEGGLGELVWMTGGMLLWIFDLAALARGEQRAAVLVNPLGARAMGLTMLAVVVAGLRQLGPGRSWSWTNVLGWALGLFWIGMAAASFYPSRSPGLALR